MSNIRIDFSKETAPIKIMHAVNNGPLPRKKDQVGDNFEAYKAARIPYARNHDAAFYSGYGGEHTVDVHAIFPNFDADVNDPTAYDFFYTDKYIADTFDAGTETFYRLGSKIEHGLKKYGTLPPKDFHKWAEICEHIIRHYTEGWADGFRYHIEYWEIWNEPDLDEDNAPNKRTWSGTWAQFFDLYEIAAKHLKACFPHLKIGGPALAYRLEWIHLFLPEMKKRNVPIDFFSWHFYSNNPHTGENRAHEVQALLEQYGYGDAESICNEWNYVKDWTDNFVYSIEQIIGIKGAAFTASTMLYAQNSPVDMMMYYDARPGGFNGLFDYYTKRPLKGYYPFVMWSKLCELGTAVATANDNPNVAAVAAKGTDGKAAVMLSYFCEDDSITVPEKVCLHLENLSINTLTAYPLDRERSCQPTEMESAADITLELYPNTVVFLLANGASLYQEG
ncbi:MAG: hypothetical protein IJW92_10055 [Clostridia bacterium]|nr:hypothetical protein [Clostridia bacterium]